MTFNKSLIKHFTLQMARGLWSFRVIASPKCSTFFFFLLLGLLPHLLTSFFMKHYHLSLPYHTIPYHTIPYHTIPYHTIPYHTIPYHTWPDLTWPDLTLPYLTWPDLTWPDLTWPDLTLPYLTLPYLTLPITQTHSLGLYNISFV